MALSMRSSARSTTMPVGSPFASRRIFPPGGSAVSRVTLARRSASELAQAACPSTRRK